MGAPISVRRVGCPLRSVSNTCYISALASFLHITYYEAFVLLQDGPPPDSDCRWFDFGMPIEDFSARVRAFGFREYERPRNYTGLRKNALIIAAWDSCWGCDSLHVLVWDGRKRVRVDPNGLDTMAKYGGVPIRVFVAA